jgi:glycosyltransferase involved in cell wall biosynthesis
MRILQIKNFFKPALGYQAVFLSRELQRLGHEVIVITSNRSIRSTRSLASVPGDLSAVHAVGRTFEDGLDVIRLPVLFEMASRPWLIGLEKTVRELQPDAVHAHNFVELTTLRLVLLKLFHRLPARLVIDDHMYPSISKNKLRRLYRLTKLYSPLARQAADAIVAVSPTTVRFMIDNYGLRREDISVIPLAADARLFRFDAQARAEVRDVLSIPGDAFVVIYTGKLVVYKHVHLLVDAFLRLAQQYANVLLILVGFHDEAYVQSIKQRIVTTSASERVRWLPGVPNRELYRHFSAADVAVWPAEHTISILEAMACALPVIVSDEPRSADEVGYGNGLVFQKGNVAELVHALESLISNRQKARNMGQKGLQAVQEHYNWETVAKQFLRLYEGGE